MYRATTRKIQVDVEPQFLADRSDPQRSRFFWSYTVTIANLGESTVQLMTRHWRITDGNGKLEEVRGAGVVGEQPILKPGEKFRYTSGCPLTTASGFMSGAYRMVDEDGKSFDIDIPTFSLDCPQARRVLN
jgi:ApaG protein